MAQPTHDPEEEDGRPRPYRPPEWYEAHDDDTKTLDGEYVEDAPPAVSPPPTPTDPAAAPLVPPARPMGPVAVIGTVLGMMLLVGCIGFSVQRDWPAIVPITLLIIGATLIGLRMIRGTSQAAEKKAASEAATPILHPSRRVERALSPGERLYIETHEHPLSAAPWIVAIVLSSIFAGWLSTSVSLEVGVGFWIIAMLFCLYRIYWWQRRIFCVTDRYIVLIEGVFTTNENRMLINRLTDAKKVVPWHSKMLAWLRITNLSYGTFHLETAGQEQAINKVGWLPGINQLTRITMSLASGNRPDLPPE